MQTLKMKIHEYDEQNGSLIVSFSTDESLGTPDDYRPIAFQPNIYAEYDSAETEVFNIAVRGLPVAKEQDRLEKLTVDQNRIDYYNSLVGQTLTYNVTNGVLESNDVDLTTIIIP